MNQSILIADDDEGILSALGMLLKSESFTPVIANSPQQVLSALQNQDVSLVLIDLNYSLDTTSGEEGLELINSIRKIDDLIPIVVMTGWGTIELAVSTMKNGANDFIQKPWENDRLLAIIKSQIKLASIQKQSQRLFQQNKLLRDEVSPRTKIVAESESLRRVLETVEQLATSDVSVMFTGENGTGKSMHARHLHEISLRKDAELIAINMGAITESLFESEMFGHVQGAFTDAKATRIGRIELADGGTLFLDEIANTPYSQQGKLLRVLEDQQYEKVGSKRTQTVDFRLISATNSDLNLAVAQGRFRKDLLYRINTVEIEIPPLRERVEDIIPLAKSFLEQIGKKYSLPKLSIGQAALRALQSYPWPGNVRELNHVMERAQVLCKSSTIEVEDLGLDDRLLTPQKNNDESAVCSGDLKSIDQIEADVINQRLAHFNGDATKAAKSLGVSRSAFYRRLGKSKE